jgi:hypothetical protein
MPGWHHIANGFAPLPPNIRGAMAYNSHTMEFVGFVPLPEPAEYLHDSTIPSGE